LFNKLNNKGIIHIELKMNFSHEQKVEMAKRIKPLTIAAVAKDYARLSQLGDCIPDGSRAGNNVVDYFTMLPRLHTRGKMNLNFFEFVEQLDEYKKKHYVANLFRYYHEVRDKNGKKDEFSIIKEVYNLAIGCIHIFKPTAAMQIYRRYAPRRVLDPTAGWGGRMVAACACNLEAYIGIDLNISLIQHYKEMQKWLEGVSTTQTQMHWCSALSVDYSALDYDMVLTSPPYYNIERYEHSAEYSSKREMNEKFYMPLFEATWKHLKIGGAYCLNVNKEIYETACIPVLGAAHAQHQLGKSNRALQNSYVEYIYVWIK